MTSLTKRIIGKILVNDLLVIQSYGYKKHLPIGRIDIVAKYLCDWGVDELIVVDRLASSQNRCIKKEVISYIVQYCFVPLTVCGGIKNIDDAQALINAGADRVALNSILFPEPSILPRFVKTLGSSTVLAVVDVVRRGQGFYVFDYRNQQVLDKEAVYWCQVLQECGVGELMINSVDRDGQGTGFEDPLYETLRQRLHIPIIASGGFGHPNHAESVLNAGADGVAIGNALHHSEHSVAQLKRNLASMNIRPLVEKHELASGNSGHQ